MSIRGEVTATIGGEEIKLSLTLGAMAEIEERLGVDSFNEALVMIEKVSMRAMLVVIECCARAAGSDIDASKLQSLEAVEAIGALVDANFPKEAAPKRKRASAKKASQKPKK